MHGSQPSSASQEMGKVHTSLGGYGWCIPQYYVLVWTLDVSDGDLVFRFSRYGRSASGWS